MLAGRSREGGAHFVMRVPRVHRAAEATSQTWFLIAVRHLDLTDRGEQFESRQRLGETATATVQAPTSSRNRPVPRASVGAFDFLEAWSSGLFFRAIRRPMPGNP